MYTNLAIRPSFFANLFNESSDSPCKNTYKLMKASFLYNVFFYCVYMQGMFLVHMYNHKVSVG